MSDKYICYKTDDWDAFVRMLQDGPKTVEASFVLTRLPDAVPDAEVFRHQDLVSPPILYAASSIYQSYIELLGPYMAPSEKEYMTEVVHHFFEAAEKAAGLPRRKLPD